MKQPRLIQRCELAYGNLIYEYMGSAEFETDRQETALKRIFAAGMVMDSVTITLHGKEIPVYMVAVTGFAFADYQLYLQQIVENKLHLQERTYFDDVMKAKAGLETFFGRRVTTQVWFDMENDVLWTVAEEDQRTLIAVLENIKKKWAA